MRTLTFAALALTTFALFAQTPKEQRYTVIVGEDRAGTTRLSWVDPTHANVETNTSVRGWIGSGRVAYVFDRKGLLLKLEGRSESNTGSPQSERFEWKNSRATWESNVERGNAAVKGAAFYISASAGDAVEIGFLVKALRLASKQELPLLPEGKAHFRRLRKEVVGTLTVELVEITGIGLDPVRAWLDPEGDLFALLPGLIRVGFEDHLNRLKEIENARAAELARKLAKDVLRPLTGPFLVQDVSVFDAEAAVILPHRSVLVEEGVIKAVEAHEKMKSPVGATIIDGRGKTLIPGLWDMHGHVTDATDAYLTLAAGVTTYRDLGNEARRRDALVAAFERGELAGPRVIKCFLINAIII